MSATRQLVLQFVGALALFTFAKIGLAADPVQWRTDYDSARKEATENKKLLLLDFGTVDCVHCRRMHQTTFRDPAIAKALSDRFVAVYIDANREARLAQTLRIQAYPTVVLAGNDGKILAWIEGYMEANRFLEQLNRAAALQTPDWMVRDYQEATKAASAGEVARAIALFKNVVADGKDRSIQVKARNSLQETEMQAAGRLTRARQLDEKGQTLEAVDLLAELVQKYAGSAAALEAGKLLTVLAEKPEAQLRQRSRRARELLASAREELKAERFLDCLDRCEILSAAYRDLAEGKEGEVLAASIKNDPSRMTKVCDAMNDRIAAAYLTLADSWAKQGNVEQAADCLERVLKIKPNGSAAAQAQSRLTRIHNKVPATPVSFPKP